MDLYRRIAAIRTNDDASDLMDEMIDPVSYTHLMRPPSISGWASSSAAFLGFMLPPY